MRMRLSFRAFSSLSLRVAMKLLSSMRVLWAEETRAEH
jgi:hypothetical protein